MERLPRRRTPVNRAVATVLAFSVGLTVAACGRGEPGDPARRDDRSSLQHATSSLEALGVEVLAALETGDIGRLDELALNELEFRTVVWPELPSSQPARGVPFDYAWQDLYQKSTNERRRTVHRHGGQRLTLVGIEFTDETTVYETFVVHRDSLVTVRTASGQEQRVRLFGAVLQRGREFKVFSYVVD